MAKKETYIIEVALNKKKIASLVVTYLLVSIENSSTAKI